MPALVLITIAIAAMSNSAEAQVVPEYERYSPLSQWQSPGLAARFAGMTGRSRPDWYQPIRIILEGGGEVTTYYGRPIQGYAQQSPAQLGVQVGQSYRVKLSGMPGLPGVELYPTLEIIDRLHPPKGQKHNYPILVHIDQDDVELVLRGHLVTRVIYLEDPRLAAPFTLDTATRTRTIRKTENVLAQADRYGRPMVIVRLGGRLPSVHGEPESFYGTGAPIVQSRPTAPATKPESDPPGASRKEEAS